MSDSNHCQNSVPENPHQLDQVGDLNDPQHPLNRASDGDIDGGTSIHHPDWDRVDVERAILATTDGSAPSVHDSAERDAQDVAGTQLVGYDSGDGYDEVFAGPGRVRSPYGAVLTQLATTDLHGVTERLNDRVAALGAVFGGSEAHPFRVDSIPRLIGSGEWARIAHGAEQRLRALEALVSDVYGSQRVIADGIVPRAVLEETPYFERDLVGGTEPAGGWIAIAGFDLVRDADGQLRVLEDNLRTPSGVAYAQAAADAFRTMVEETGVVGLPDHDLVSQAAGLLRQCLEASAPHLTGELVILTDGETNSAHFEHRRLADATGLRLVTPSDLRRDDNEIHLIEGGRVRAIYRRTDDDQLRTPDGELTPLADLLLQPTKTGQVGLVNQYGTGVGDDKKIYSYVDDLVRYYLNEQPALPSVATHDVTDHDQDTGVLDKLDQLVAKPRDGHGGQGVVVGPAASSREIDEARDAAADDPTGWVIQDPVTLSTCPVVVDGHLEPRHVDLRVFAYRVGERVTVLRGGLTRVALEAGSMVVNSSRAGGGKPTWVITTHS